MAIVTREEIRTRKALRSETSDVEGFGTVKIRELSIGESKRLALLQDKGFDAATYVLTRGMLNVDGSQMFPDVTLKDDGTLEVSAADQEDLESFGTYATSKIVDLVLSISGMKRGQEGPKASAGKSGSASGSVASSESSTPTSSKTP